MTADDTTNQLIWGPPSTESLLYADGVDYFVYGSGATPVEQYNLLGYYDYEGDDEGGPFNTVEFINYSIDDGMSFYVTTDPDGEMLNEWAYNPFGVPAQEDPESGSEFGFAGQYTDNANADGSNYSDLVNMRARWYAPGTGEFSTVDPDLSTTNQPYEYAGGDPVNGSDPSGSVPTCIFDPEACDATEQQGQAYAYQLANPCGSSTQSAGSEGFSNEYSRLQYAYDSFVGDGMTPAQASGIVGNLIEESQIQPISQDIPGVAYGIAQWNPDRWDEAKQTDPKVNSPCPPIALEAQIAYIVTEMTSTNTQVEYLQVEGVDTYADYENAPGLTTDPAAAAAAYFNYYEAGSDLPNREFNAEAVFSIETGAPFPSGYSSTWPWPSEEQ